MPACEGNVSGHGIAIRNLMIVCGGTVYAPAPHGGFLAGIARARVIRLLGQSDVEVVECRLGVREVLAAEEAFGMSNYGRMLPVHRIDDQMYASGPITQLTQQRYHAFAHREPVVTVAV